MPYYSTDRFFAQSWHLRPYEDVPLPVAVALAELVTDACRWFHDPKHLFLGDPGAPAFPDEVVEEVCAALQRQLDKEGKPRTRGAMCSRHGVAHGRWYHLTELPAAYQRALVERVWALRERHALKVRVWNSNEAPPAAPPSVSVTDDSSWP